MASVRAAHRSARSASIRASVFRFFCSKAAPRSASAREITAKNWRNSIRSSKLSWRTRWGGFLLSVSCTSIFPRAEGSPYFFAQAARSHPRHPRQHPRKSRKPTRTTNHKQTSKNMARRSSDIIVGLDIGTTKKTTGGGGGGGGAGARHVYRGMGGERA